MTPAYVAWPSCYAALVISSHARSPPMKIVRPLTPLRQRMLEDLQIRNYSPHTVDAYLRAVAQFAKHFRTSPDRLGAEHIRTYHPHTPGQGETRSLRDALPRPAAAAAALLEALSTPFLALSGAPHHRAHHPHECRPSVHPSGPCRPAHQGRVSASPKAQLRDASARSGRRPAPHPIAAGAREPAHHEPLPPCGPPGAPCHREPL